MHRRLLVIPIALLASSARFAHGDDNVLADMAARVEYAYYTQNQRDLAQTVQEIEKSAATAQPALRLSWLNYGRWKLAQSLATSQPAQAEQAAERCSAESWPDKLSPDAQAIAAALRAACHAMLAELRPLRAVLQRHDRDRNLEMAMQKGGEIPQVLLISAWLAVREDDAKTAALRLRKAASLSDALERTGQQRSDDWGQAELYYLLGKVDVQRGDMLAARNDLERALVVAPDYQDAASLLKSLRVK